MYTRCQVLIEYREPLYSYAAGYDHRGSAYASVPAVSHDLPSRAAVHQLRQPSRLHGRQCWDFRGLVGTVSVAGRASETAVYEEMGCSGDGEGSNYWVLLCESGRRWVGVYLGKEGRRGG